MGGGGGEVYIQREVQSVYCLWLHPPLANYNGEAITRRKTRPRIFSFLYRKTYTSTYCVRRGAAFKRNRVCTVLKPPIDVSHFGRIYLFLSSLPLYYKPCGWIAISDTLHLFTHNLKNLPIKINIFVKSLVLCIPS
jgi:hypothetical protein